MSQAVLRTTKEIRKNSLRLTLNVEYRIARPQSGHSSRFLGCEFCYPLLPVRDRLQLIRIVSQAYVGQPLQQYPKKRCGSSAQKTDQYDQQRRFLGQDQIR